VKCSIIVGGGSKIGVKCRSSSESSHHFFLLNLISKVFHFESTSRDRMTAPTLLNTITDDKLEWIHIVCGGYHTAALTKKGEVMRNEISCEVQT
jgi:hypothetical protein